MNLKVLRRETTHAQRLIKCLRACWGWRTRRREIDWNMLKISKFQPLSSYRKNQSKAGNALATLIQQKRFHGEQVGVRVRQT